MDPISMAAIGTGLAQNAGAIGLAGTALSAGATAYGAYAQGQAMQQQAEAEQAAAARNAQWADRQADEALAASQSQAAEDQRAKLRAQSRLGAIAGASGSGASDPGVMTLWSGIEAEGNENAARSLAAGQQRAAGMNYGAQMDQWRADSNARIQKAAAKSTTIGGVLNATGKVAGGMGDYFKTRSQFKSGGGRTGYSYYGGYR